MSVSLFVGLFRSRCYSVVKILNVIPLHFFCKFHINPIMNVFAKLTNDETCKPNEEVKVDLRILDAFFKGSFEFIYKR